jgi:hypothetical protein
MFYFGMVNNGTLSPSAGISSGGQGSRRAASSGGQGSRRAAPSGGQGSCRAAAHGLRLLFSRLTGRFAL